MVKISNGARVLYQWERGVKLTVTGQCDIVRMSREDDSGAKDFVPYKNGAEKEVEVPDFLLTESGYLRVSIIIRENDTERILETARFIIRPMQKSNNRAMSERDVGSWLVLKMRMDALERAAREGKFNGDNGITPHIGENGNWFLGDTDTGVQARGEDGITPHIGENGNWFFGDTDTGVPATGGGGGIEKESDPTVPEWAKQPDKPTYTAEEVGAQPVGDYPTRNELPVNTSDLTNDSGFITRLVSDLENYYTKSQTYTKTEIDQKVSAIPKFAISVVSSLPTSDISDTTVYLVKSGTGDDLYTEYIHVNGVWEILGSQRVDLTGYATETWVDTKLDDYLKAGDIADWAKAATKPAYSKSEVGLGNVANERQYSANNPPPYPVKSVNGVTGDVETPKAFYIVVTDSGNGKYTIDKTADEIKAAYGDNYILFAKLNTLIMPLRSVTINQTPIGDEWEVIFEAEEKLTQGFVHSFKSTRIRLYGMSTFSVDFSETDRKMITQAGAMNMFSQVGHTHESYEIGGLDELIDGAIEDIMIPRTATPQMYGAKGDGTTDDTNAFVAALAEERVVYVPGGTYKLSDTLFVGENCCLELSQDTVLEFTQTDKNCITLLRLAHLKGNHATIFVPYEYTANVINCDGKDDTDQLDSSDYTTSNATAVPPFTKWDPQWRMSRYVTDINICKRDYRGFHYSVDGTCSGTAVYLHLDEDDFIHYMWGVDMSGVRIAGAFTYGIRVINVGDATKTVWNHDMRIEAFMEACKIGLSVDNCNSCRFAVTFQPKRALATDGTTYIPYAERGIELTNCRQIDLMGCRVWDWNATNTLWRSGNDKQHLVLIGDCTGLILDDFIYYEESGDLRDRIYTDTPANFEKMTILQEPITRWFKVVDGEPYYVDKNTPEKLAKQTDVDLLNANFITDTVPTFTNQLAIAVGEDGKTVYNGIGYKNGTAINVNHPASDFDYAYTAATGFIPCKIGSRIRTKNFTFANYSVGNTRVVFYDADRNSIAIGGGYALSVTAGDLVGNTGGGNNYTKNYVKTDTGFEVTIGDTAYTKNVAYVRFVVNKNDIGEKPVITVDEEIEYIAAGFLADGIKIKAENVVGGGGTGGTSIDVTAEVGQTIIVKEIDANGKPTKWESADYQPRTHWSEYEDVVLVDNQSIGEYDEVIFDFLLVAGQSYHIVFNGAEYDEVARNAEMSGMTIVALGNLGIIGGEDTGEPYVIISTEGVGTSSIPAGGDYTFYTLTLSTTQEVAHKMPLKYVPEEVLTYAPVYVKCVQGETVQDQMPLIKVSSLEKMIDAGRTVIMKVTPDQSGTYYLQLCYDLTSEGQRIFNFMGLNYNLLLDPQDDDSYRGIFTSTN